MSLLKTIVYLLFIGIVLCGNAHADFSKNCGDYFHLPCNNDAYGACLKDLCEGHEWLCEYNHHIYNEVVGVCACDSLADKQDKKAAYICSRTKSPVVWKASAEKIEERENHCSDYFGRPCDEDKNRACLKDLCLGHEWLCEHNLDVHHEVGLVCACDSLTYTQDMDANNTCSKTKSPAAWKTWIVRTDVGSPQYCNDNINAPCNKEAYNTCLKDLCPEKHDVLCEGRHRQVEDICACDSLINKQEPLPHGNNTCKLSESPAVWKAWATRARIEAKRPHYCGGYVHFPCDEEKFKACVSDFATTFCPNGGCEGIGPAMLASCACENLVDKANMSNETMCQSHMSPAELKAGFLEAINAQKELQKNSPKLYCGGYLHYPCDTEKFQICLKDFANTFCPAGRCAKSVCPGWSPDTICGSMNNPAVTISCACDNLMNPEDKNKAPTTDCAGTVPPAELKARLLTIENLNSEKSH